MICMPKAAIYIRRKLKWRPLIIEPPGIGKDVVTDEGMGKVLKINRNKKTVKVQLEEGRTIDLPWTDIVLPDEE